MTGDCIRCPFHDWKFSGDSGKCVEVRGDRCITPGQVPYDKKSTIPGKASLTTYRCIERNRLVRGEELEWTDPQVMMWYHVEEEEPTWFPPVLAEVESGAWTYRGRNENTISCHIQVQATRKLPCSQDICENGGDMAHFTAVHEASILSGGEPSQAVEDVTVPLASHAWQGTWRVGQEKHLAEVHITHSKKLLGVNILSMKVIGHQIGPSLVNLNFDTMLGRGVMLQYALPLEPNIVKLVHVFYSQPSFIAPYAKVSPVEP